MVSHLFHVQCYKYQFLAGLLDASTVIECLLCEVGFPFTYSRPQSVLKQFSGMVRMRRRQE